MVKPSQRVFNEHWPLRDSKGRGHDEGIPIQNHPIDVAVRVVFSGDGERWLYGWAIKWTKGAVCVQLDHEVNGHIRVWVAPTDVRRR